MTKVLLADDHTLVRAGFRALIESEPEFTVVGEAVDGAQAIELTRRHRPDVVLMDIQMPEVDGLEATRRIGADPALAGVRVVVLTTFELDEYVFGAIKAGAAGFLLKDVEPVALLEAVRVVAAGEALLAPRITRRLIEEFIRRGATGQTTETTRTPWAQLLDRLTPREREVLALVGRGLSNDEIAARLVVSPLTAKTHVSRLFVKLDARDRAQLVVTAYETGLVAVGDES